MMRILVQAPIDIVVNMINMLICKCLKVDGYCRRKRQSRQDATEDHSVLHNNHMYANPDKQEETVLSFTPKTVESE